MTTSEVLPIIDLQFNTRRIHFFTFLQWTFLMISINCSFSRPHTCLISVSWCRVDWRAGEHPSFASAKSCGRTSKGPFNPGDIGRWAYSDSIINPFTRNKRNKLGVQLEYPDGSSWMDRRVDKQIATREGGQEGARSDPSIYTFFILPTNAASLTWVVSLKIRGYPFLDSGQIKSVTSGVLE